MHDSHMIFTYSCCVWIYLSLYVSLFKHDTYVGCPIKVFMVKALTSIPDDRGLAHYFHMSTLTRAPPSIKVSILICVL